MTEEQEIREALNWFTERLDKKDGIVFDFARPAPKQCADCGWPYGEGLDGKRRFPLKVTECPQHQPPHWRNHANAKKA